MKENIKFWGLFLIWAAILWYVAKLILWMQFELHNYTHLKEVIVTWVLHIIFATVLPFWMTLFTVVSRLNKPKKVKKDA
jgi:hypothetical protein